MSITIEQVKEYFKNAKKVKCLSDGGELLLHKGVLNTLHEDTKNTYWTNSEYDSEYHCILLYKKGKYAEITEYKEGYVNTIKCEVEEIKPKHYNVKITNKDNEFIVCDFFDIANALGLSIEQTTALRYFRKKGGLEKQLNDTDKAIQCLQRHKDRLNTIIKK